MQRATFTIRRNGKKVGTASFIGKTWKAARATGARLLSKLSSKGGSPLSGFKRKKNRIQKKRRKKNVNFGQRMARIRARKTKARKRR